LGYVAQRSYSVSANFYNARWRDELEIKLGDHQVVIDEYHFYDPYTYLNLANALRKLGTTQLLCLSATAKDASFREADVLNAETLPRDRPDGSCGERVASFPIDVRLRGEEMRVEDAGSDETIYFYHSAITAHEMAQSLRSKGVRITEWTGIQKSVEEEAKLAIATSAAGVGLDRPFRVVHTEFWGNDWEIPSLIQRVGRVGRFEQVGRSIANVWITGREPRLLFDALENRPVMSKVEFSSVLAHIYGEESLNLEDYVSFYLWDEERTKELRRFWQTPRDIARLGFGREDCELRSIFGL
jgi:CRISPR/Cas system-associated endonuclease/helicase Cas3